MAISEWVKELRDIIGTDLVVMPAASAIVRDENGQVLLQQRSDNGLWGIPGGGIDPGEEPAEAAIREVYEETGLHVEVVHLVGVFGGKYQLKSYPNGDKVAYVSVTFECRVIGGEINPDPEESKDVRWFSIDELPSEFMKVHQRRINAIQSGKLPYFEIPESYEFASTSDYIRDIRKKVGNQLLMMPGSTALVFDDAGQVLVQKRRDITFWGLPGGYYEPGEEPAETAIREVYEETGLIVRPTRLVGVYGGDTFTYTYPNGDVVVAINIVFVCEIISGTLQGDSGESLDLRFVAADNLPEPFLERHLLLIDHALNRSEPYFAV